MNRPGRLIVALAKSSCIVSVVFPDPGPPAIRLNDRAGRPPPRTWFNPGTPVSRSGSTGPAFRGMDACLLAMMASLSFVVDDQTRPRHADLLDQTDCHLCLLYTSDAADERSSVDL